MTTLDAFPAPLDSLRDDELEVLARCMTHVRFPAGTRILKAGAMGDACYIIDRGVVRVDVDQQDPPRQSEVDSETAIDYLEAGEMVGELSLLDGLPRSASAYAQTDVEGRCIGAEDIAALAASHPRVALALYRALGRDAARKLRRSTERLAEALSGDDPDPEVEAMVKRASAAQAQIVSWSEERIDGLLQAMARAVADRAEELAAASVEETGLGKVQSKIVKQTVLSLGVCAQLVGQPGIGPIAVDEAHRITEIASPMGVVFALGPATNPVSTYIFKALICIKSRNALIYSPNRRAQNVAAHVGRLIQDVLRAHGAPPDLVQCVGGRTSRKQTRDFMTHPSVSFILATGGPSMVRAAYSSGTPAIGVGPGNTPTLICADADIPRVVKGIVRSKTFDHGMMCGSEHNLVVVAPIRRAFIEECERRGAAVLSPDETVRFTRLVVDEGSGGFSRSIVGQPAAPLAREAGITRDRPIELIVVPVSGVREDNPYAREKLAPFLSLFTVEDAEEGLRVCFDLLMIDGTGHTAVIHTEDESLIRRFGDLMPASRILVNSPAMYGMAGFTTGLALSATLGCGTFGGTSTTDSVTHVNLRNVKRLARFLPQAAAQWEGLLEL
ncbi:MAG: aldehyde dehydrogenase family protein [Chloroflexi bacterium]|nr:aldehyde dehydrogenase family protein [Chloroflexota bacterium]